MCRISRLLAESLTDLEFGVLKSISISSDDLDALNLSAVEILSHLRLLEFGSHADAPMITHLGHSVLCDRRVRDQT